MLCISLLLIYLYYIDSYTEKVGVMPYRILNTEYFCVINKIRRKIKTGQSYKTLL